MKLAAYQVPLEATSSLQVLALIRQQIDWCAANGVDVLCCPEAVLGGLADYSPEPAKYALSVATGDLNRVLQPLASDKVTTILGFTELGAANELYNSAAVFHKGAVVGIYRKVHPFINKSIYAAGKASPVFTIGDLTFGVIICLDSNYAEPARSMAAQGARVLFIPSNNGMPEEKGGQQLIVEARNADIRLAKENNVHVIRADVAGDADGLMSRGSSGIVDRNGTVVRSARQLSEDLIVANL